jgi:beta-phosphoglucomutase-like phosphatase (HAD superfamily)
LSAVEQHALPKAVATSTRREKAIDLLKRADLLQHLNTVVGGDEVANGKPHPDIFLMAAKRLNIDPKYCVVFEDSAAGIKAAHAACMIPVLIPDLVAPSPEMMSLAYRIYSSLGEASEMFEKAGRGAASQ